MHDDALHIRSFRVVFDLERRIHRIDRFRVPLPYGLPLRSLAYAVAALIGILAMRRVPGLGELIAAIPPPARLVLAPVAISYGLTRVRLDGRSAHAAAISWLTFLTAPKRLAAFEPVPRAREAAIGDLTMAPNALGGAWRRGIVHGPADVFVGADAVGRGAGELISLESGRRLILR
jgi:hypothetical protein